MNIQQNHTYVVKFDRQNAECRFLRCQHKFATHNQHTTRTNCATFKNFSGQYRGSKSIHITEKR